MSSAARFPRVPSALVADPIRQVAEQFCDAAVRDFIPVLVARQVQARLAVDDQPSGDGDITRRHTPLI